jgi:hypothetical protein
MSPLISPNSSSTVDAPGRRSGRWKPEVKIHIIQMVTCNFNDLLAADSLQNFPDTLQRSTTDCAFSHCDLPCNETGF